MRHVVLAIFLMLQFGLVAQTKTPAKTPAKKPVKGSVVTADSLRQVPLSTNDTIDKKDSAIRASGRFAVYSKMPHGKEKKMKLCIQLQSDTLISSDSVLMFRDAPLNYCYTDSLCKDPEHYTQLFRKTDGDTIFVLLYVDAFSKAPNKPECNSGHETKLFFFRWNPAENKAIVKQKTISSCMRGITNMTMGDVKTWDKHQPLKFSFHKGGVNFAEVTFDPNEYKKGLQETSD